MGLCRMLTLSVLCARTRVRAGHSVPKSHVLVNKLGIPLPIGDYSWIEPSPGSMAVFEKG